MLIHPSASIDEDFATMLNSEWWLANGAGGYSSGTVLGANTRKYHGLLVAANNTASERFLLLSKIEETVLLADKKINLSTNFYPNTIHPKGYKHMINFSYDASVARWDYNFNNRWFIKEVWCPKGQNQTYIRYSLLKGAPFALELYPLVNSRNVHSIGLANNLLNEKYSHVSQRSIFFKTPFVWGIQADSGVFRPNYDVYKNFIYPVEKERETEYSEDLLNPGKFSSFLQQGQSITLRALVATDNSQFNYPPEPTMAMARMNHLISEFRDATQIKNSPGLDSLVRSSDLFFIKTAQGYNIIAGYPYFGCWARDAMISLPGLCVYTKRFDLAREILTTWINYLKDGLLPNRIDERGDPSYESADGFFYMMWAISELEKEGGITNIELSKWWPKIKDALFSIMKSNKFLFISADGLINLKKGRLTWMDVQINGKPVTPRPGKRIEINALWIHALNFAIKIARNLNDTNTLKILHSFLIRAKSSIKKFYNEDLHYLNDAIEPTDSSLRPNQLWAFALDDIGFSKSQMRNSLQLIKEKLLVPGVGLKTLDSDNPNYKSRYAGSQHERDLAYHQGAIWPWLIGIYVASYLKLNPSKYNDLKSELSPLLSTNKKGALLSLAEVYDPTTHDSRGCPLQAWSVAEVIRASILLERLRIKEKFKIQNPNI